MKCIFKTKEEIPYDSGIYKITNVINHKLYIGSAVSLRQRMFSHYSLLCKNEHHNPHLQNAWNQYGEDAFEFEVVERCSMDEILEREQYWMDYYKVYDNQYGYNICRVAGNTSGRKFSEETKDKIRRAQLGVKESEVVKKQMSIRMSGDGNPMYGKHHTEESKQKMRERSPDYNGDNNPFYGKHHSAETKQKLRDKAMQRDKVTHAKLSKQNVFDIKCELLKKPDDVPWIDVYKTLAAKYNVAVNTIKNIKQEYRWRDLTVNVYVDKKNHFVEMFNPDNGFYVRSGIMDENGHDTGVDPFMRQFPSLLDIGIMQTCVCSHRCNVDCYQKAIERTGKNMSIEDFETILKQGQGKLFQVALGGAGDVDTHENFEEIVKLCRQYNIVPNFTTSGILMTKEKAEICKKYCGAVAVSEHFADYTERALDLLMEAGVKTNIHYVLSNKSIDTAIERLKNNSFKKGINAVVFLLYKPVGLGREENMLRADDPRVKEFFELIDKGDFHHKIGFDSCSAAGIVNFTSNVNLDSLDFCEGARYSAYVDANMNMMPCSFANQDSSWFVNLREHTVQEAWDSEIFEKFRYSLRNSCAGCKNRACCGGGCPLVNQIALCNSHERKFETL